MCNCFGKSFILLKILHLVSVWLVSSECRRRWWCSLELAEMDCSRNARWQTLVTGAWSPTNHTASGQLSGASGTCRLTWHCRTLWTLRSRTADQTSGERRGRLTLGPQQPDWLRRPRNRTGQRMLLTSARCVLAVGLSRPLCTTSSPICPARRQSRRNYYATLSTRCRWTGGQRANGRKRT